MRSVKRWAVLAPILLAALAACGPAPESKIVTDAKAREKAWATEHAKREAAENAARNAADIAAVEAAPDCPSDRFRFTPDDKLSIFELAALGVETKEDPPAKGRGLVFLPFDYDLHPLRGKWGAVGVIYVRGDPPDRRTIGGVLWTRTPDFLSSGGGHITRGPDGESLTVSLAPDYADPQGTKIICIGRFRSHLAPDGTLTAGGERIGVFR